jgi:hypothetical protein
MPTPSKSAPAHTTSISSVPAVKGPTKASPLTAIPASARVHPTTVKAAVKASTPTTTYVPASGISGGISLTRKAGVGTTATGTTATPAKSTVLGYLVLHKRSQHSNTLSTRAFEPHWLLSLRHAMAEAGFRLSATWAEFSDWVRLGH